MYERKKVNTLAKDYEQVLDIYEVDKYGNVYGKDGNELKYKQVALKLKGERRWKKCFVHRLVGYGFVSGHSEQYNEIDHIDTNKTNNKHGMVYQIFINFRTDLVRNPRRHSVRNRHIAT